MPVAPREQGVLRWLGEPVFTGERWAEDGLWHLTAEEVGLMVAAPSVDLAAGKLVRAAVDLLWFLVAIPDHEITDTERQLRAVLLLHLRPVLAENPDVVRVSLD